MQQNMPFVDVMKLPMNIGSAVIEGGEVGLKGGDPLLATATKLEAAFKKPLWMMMLGGQPPEFAPVLEQFKAMAMPPLPQNIFAMPGLPAGPMNMGGEIVGQESKIGPHEKVRTNIY